MRENLEAGDGYNSMISMRENEVLIDVNTFTAITKKLGIRYNKQTWRNQMKNGKFDNSVESEGKMMIWVDKAIYYAVFPHPEQICVRCESYKTTLQHIHNMTI